MNYFILECKRMFSCKRYKIACLLVGISLICGAWDMLWPGYDLIEAMRFSMFANSFAFLALLWTIVGSIPWASSFFEERESI